MYINLMTITRKFPQSRMLELTSVVVRIVTVDPSDTVLVAAKKMLEVRTSSAIVTVENKPRGILT